MCIEGWLTVKTEVRLNQPGREMSLDESNRSVLALKPRQRELVNDQDRRIT